MKNQENDTFSLAQGKYPWGFIKKVNQTANSFNRLPDGSRFLGRNIIDEFVIKLQRKKRSNIDETINYDIINHNLNCMEMSEISVALCVITG